MENFPVRTAKGFRGWVIMTMTVRTVKGTNTDDGFDGESAVVSSLARHRAMETELHGRCVLLPCHVFGTPFGRGD